MVLEHLLLKPIHNFYRSTWNMIVSAMVDMVVFTMLVITMVNMLVETVNDGITRWYEMDLGSGGSRKKFRPWPPSSLATDFGPPPTKK